MNKATNRLYFIDAIRAWAILMMLQGHFVDGLLDMDFRDNTNPFFAVWKYFRGITAPVFFTVSGFIFTYLLIKGEKKLVASGQTGQRNPRIKKGIKRGLELLFIGYLLRSNLFGLFSGEVYASFYLVDVLHCIGLSILGIIVVHQLVRKRNKYLFPLLLFGITVLLFLFEPAYKSWQLGFLPDAIANYVTKANGSVFTIFPWFGYATFGGFLSVLFTRFREEKFLYPVAIVTSILLGTGLIFGSSEVFLALSRTTGIQLFADVFFNNYLFIRLGDVFLVFALFMLCRRWMQNRTLLAVGSSTLSIYVVHFIILYGSFTGLGLYRFFQHSLSPFVVIGGALVFMFVCTYVALEYEKNKVAIKLKLATAARYAWVQMEFAGGFVLELAKEGYYRLLRVFGLEKN